MKVRDFFSFEGFFFSFPSSLFSPFCCDKLDESEVKVSAVNIGGPGFKAMPSHYSVLYFRGLKLCRVIIVCYISGV